MNIKPFNNNYKIMSLVYMLLGIVTCVYVSKLDEVAAKIFMIRYSLFLLVFVVVYRTYLLFDREYNMIAYGKNRSDFFNELLLFPCNVCCFFCFLGIYFNLRILQSFTFYVSFAATTAFLFPSKGCDEGSFYKPRIFCFYTTHYMILFSAFLLVISGIFVPTFKDALITIIFYEAISFILYWFNLFLRKTKLNPVANYFFNVEPDGNPVLEIFYKIVPIGYVYTFLPSLVFLLIFEIITLITHLFI